MSMANIRKLQENTAALVQNGCSPILVGAISGSGYVHPGKFETPSSPIRRHVPDAKYPDGMCRMQDIRVESGGSRMKRQYPVRICYPDALRWCIRTPLSRYTPCILDLLMDSKELSSISDCFGDKKAIKTPKLNTI